MGSLLRCLILLLRMIMAADVYMMHCCGSNPYLFSRVISPRVEYITVEAGTNSKSIVNTLTLGIVKHP